MRERSRPRDDVEERISRSGALVHVALGVERAGEAERDAGGGIPLCGLRVRRAQRSPSRAARSAPGVASRESTASSERG
jgi:hypothetical protein